MQNYSDLEDKNSFGLLLKSTREYYGINQSKLAKGIISTSRLSMIENGKREADYKLRNRLLGRLGYTLEGFEEFLKISDYKRYEKYSELTDAVENNDNMAQQLVNELISTRDKEDIIEYQFLLDMYARYLWHNKVNKKEIEDIYHEAIQLTMAGINENNINEYALAPEEYYLLIQKMEFMEADSSFDKLSILVNHLRDKEMGDIAKAKVYPKAVYLYSRRILSLHLNDDYLLKALEYSSEAINILVNARRFYYLYNLLNIRKELFIHISINDEKKTKEREENLRYLSSCQYIYSFLPKKKNMENDCYIYRSGMCYYVGDIIYKRRKMLGMSRNDLAEGICSTRTLIRIEKMQADVQWGILKEILGRLHLPMNICRGDLVTSDFKLIQAKSRFAKLENDREYEKSKLLLNKIKNELDLSYETNMQFIQKSKCLRQYNTGIISKTEYEKHSWEILSLTGITKENAFSSESYYTRLEKEIICNLVTRGLYIEQFKKYISDEINNNFKIKNYSIYEMEMSLYTRYLEEEGDVALAIRLRKDIIINLINRHRATMIAINFVNFYCDIARKRGDYKNKEYCTYLEKAIIFCELMKQEKLKELIIKYLLMAKKGDDWTK